MNHFFSIDVETANADRSSICQIGIVAVEDGVITSEWSSLVNPEVDFHPRNRILHGISARMVADQPTFSDVYAELEKFMQGTLLVAHSRFDKQALLAAAIKSNLAPYSPVWLDSRQIAKAAWHDTDICSNGLALDEICTNLGISFEHHDALEDAKAIAQIVIRACEDTKLAPQELNDKGDILWGPNPSKKSSIGSTGIDLINAEASENKAIAYWVGFLKGVVASKDVVEYEIDPLIAQSEDFLSKFDDRDAEELLQDIEIWRDKPSEILGVLNNIIDARDKLDNLPTTQINKFYGFLKGVACDGVVCERELELLLAELRAHPELREDPRVNQIYSVGNIALEDGVVTKHESDELCLYISRVVGESFHDTGISQQSGMPNLDGEVSSFDEIIFEERKFVLTGSFEVPKSIYASRLERLGANVMSAVSRKTDYLIIADNGSSNYKTTNAGTKMLKAIELHAKNGRPEFIKEGLISRIIKSD